MLINNTLVPQLYGIALSVDQWKLLLKSRKLADRREVEIPSLEPFDAVTAMKNFVNNFGEDTQ